MADEKINEVLSSVFSNSELMDKISNIVKDKKGESKEDALPEIISAISEKVKIPTQGEGKEEMNNEKAEAVSSSFFSDSTKNSAALLESVLGDFFKCVDVCKACVLEHGFNIGKVLANKLLGTIRYRKLNVFEKLDITTLEITEDL